MPEYPWPEWMKTSIDQRFHELARLAGLTEEVKSIRQKQAEVEAKLKQELEPQLFRIILDWEDALNYRNTLEKEWMYLAGFKDGLRFYKQLLDFISSNADKSSEPQ
jgi:hypothetical protein